MGRKILPAMGEVTMKIPASAMRGAVLSRMCDLLEQTYGIQLNREEFTGERASLHAIDAVLSFKSDPRLDELRGALDRIEDGTFGVCIGCKKLISQPLLTREPARRMCEECERKYNRSSTLFVEAHLVH